MNNLVVLFLSRTYGIVPVSMNFVPDQVLFFNFSSVTTFPFSYIPLSIPADMLRPFFVLVFNTLYDEAYQFHMTLRVCYPSLLLCTRTFYARSCFTCSCLAENRDFISSVSTSMFNLFPVSFDHMNLFLSYLR